VIKNNVNSVLEKGVPYTELYNIEDYLNKLQVAVPEIENIQIYSDAIEIGQGTSIDDEYVYIRRLTSDLHGKQGIVRIEISQKSIAEKLRNILLDTATVLVISFILLVEVTLFVILLLEKRISNGLIDFTWNRKTIPIIRYLAFLIFAAAYMSTTFIPILMDNLYQPLLGLPKNVVLGLPISAEMLFGALAAVGAGYSIDKTGYKPILIRGIIFFGAGTLISAVAYDAMSFIAARSIVGIGFGLVLMALRTIVVSAPDAILKNQGVAAMNSGAFAGVNCGIVIGAMLADRIGYSRVFFVACVLLIISWYTAQVFVENVVPQRVNKEVEANQPDLRTFIFDKKVLAFFMLVLIPVSISGMFLNYLFPIYADSMGVSASGIGRAFLVNGLLIIYAGPVLSRYTEKYLGTKKSLVIASLIMGFALLVFAGCGTLVAAYTAVILLGLAESFGVAAQNNYFLSLRAVSRLGEGKAVAYFSIIGKIGQMLGPIIFGSAAVWGMAEGTGVVGGIAVISFALFAISNKDFFIKKRLTRRY
ncbi:MAG: MFS transporter, partial [Clostridia bacterium]|nr:MFS transporter [Clostridia bacterium]